MLRVQRQSPKGERRDLRGRESPKRPRALGHPPVIVRVLVALAIVALATAMAVPTVTALQGVSEGKTRPNYLSPDGSRLPPCSTGATPCVVP